MIQCRLKKYKGESRMAQEQLEEVHVVGAETSGLLLGMGQSISKELCVFNVTGGHPMLPPGV